MIGVGMFGVGGVGGIITDVLVDCGVGVNVIRDVFVRSVGVGWCCCCEQ